MQVRLTPGTLPPNYCITDLQAFYQLIFANGYGTLDTTASIAKVIISSTEPTADQRDYIWIRLNPITSAFDRIYNYINGYWVSPNPISPTSGTRRIFVGSTADIDREDGGALGESIGAATGAMWQIDTAFAGRMPIGVGTLIASGTVISSGSTGGSDQTTITKANLPTDKLSVSLPIIGQGSVGSSGEPVVGETYGSDAVSGSGKAVDSTSDEFSSRYKAKGQTEAMGEATPMNTISPYYGVYILKRTARLYYRPS